MTKQEFIKRLEALSPEQVERVLPYLEADVDAADRLGALHASIAAGRKSAEEAPLQDAPAVYDHVRKSL